MNTYFCIIMALLSCQMWRVLKSLPSLINMRHARDCCNAPAIHCRSILHALCSLPLPLHHCNGAALHHLARQPFAILRDISACRAFRLHLSNATPVHPGHPASLRSAEASPSGPTPCNGYPPNVAHVLAAFFFGLSPAAAFVDCRFFVVLRHCKRRTRRVKQNQRQQRQGQPAGRGRGRGRQELK